MAAATIAAMNIPPKPIKPIKPPDPKLKSFADIVAGKNRQIEIEIKEISTYKGEPAVYFSEEDIQKLAEPFQFSLVGKFPRGRPSMENIRRFFSKLELKTEYQIGLLDSKHILIQLHNEEDYHRIWMRQQWNLYQFPMTITKWHVDFTPDNESSIMPVWVSLPHLPPHLFKKEALISIAQIIGPPMKVDNSTVNITRPSMARVCVEADISKPLPHRGWIGQGAKGFWQPFIFEDLPRYCEDCQKVGHDLSSCIMKSRPKLITYNQAQNKADEQAMNKHIKHKQAYVPKKMEEEKKKVIQIDIEEAENGEIKYDAPSQDAQSIEELPKTTATDIKSREESPKTPAKNPATDEENQQQIRRIDRAAKSMEMLLEDKCRREVNEINNKCADSAYMSENDEPQERHTPTVTELNEFLNQMKNTEAAKIDKMVKVQIEGQEYQLVSNRRKKQYTKNPELQRETRASIKISGIQSQDDTNQVSNE